MLVGAQAIVAGLNWTWVMYDFAGQHKELNVSGYNVWPLASAQVLFGLAGFAVIALTRGLARRIMAFVIATISTAMTAFNIGDLTAVLANHVPAKVNGMVEKASGVSGGAPDGSSQAILFHTTAFTLPLAFTLAALLLAMLQLGVAYTVGRWTATEKRDKYQRGASKASSLKTDANKSQKSKSQATDEGTQKGDNIALWDSQR